MAIVSSGPEIVPVGSDQANPRTGPKARPQTRPGGGAGQYTKPGEAAQERERRTQKSGKRNCEDSFARGMTFDELLHQQPRQSRRVVTDNDVLLHQAVEQAAEPESLESSEIHAHRLGALSTVAPDYICRDGLIAGHHPIKQLAPRDG